MKFYSFIPLLMGLILLIFTSQASICPQNNNKDLVQTGLIEFQNLNKRQVCRQVQIKYQVPNEKIQLAASVVLTQNYYVTNGIDYAVKVGYNLNNKFTATLLSDSSANWTKITVSYIVTSRNDLLMGSFFADSFNTLKCLQSSTGNSNKLAVSSVINSWNTNFLSAKAIAFVSGIKILSQKVQSINLKVVNLNSSGILNIQIQSSKGLEIQYLQISYILISSSFPYNHGYELNHPEYQFPVFEKFYSNKLVQVSWGISAGNLICQGIKCVSSCISQDQCQKWSGNLYNGHCYFCNQGKSWGGQQCISVCKQNQIWNSQKQQCVCQSRAIRTKSFCQICPSNSSPDKQQKQCICNSGYIWNKLTSSCIIFNCPVNSQPKINQQGYECICKTGFYKFQSACKINPQCPTNSIFDIFNKKCVCNLEGQFMSANGLCISCGKNQLWDQIFKKCICKANFINLSGNCVSCPTYSSLNSDKTKCVCNDGYIWSDWKVACIDFKCPLNSVPQPTQIGIKCNCKQGYWLNGQNCQITKKCPKNSSFDFVSKNCVCINKNNYLINGECQPCTVNSSWNGTDCTCNSGYILFGNNCVFTCGINQILQNNKCVCNSRCILFNSACQQCPVSSSPTKDKTKCLCNDGLTWDENSKSCRKFSCPQNSAWVQEKLSCQCIIRGENMINGNCRKCRNNQLWSLKDMKCSCAEGFYLIGGQCKLCQIGQTFNGRQCECNLGFYKNKNVCEQCHNSCGTCSGPNNNQCLSCVDVTFNFKNGSCTKDGVCPKGLYQRSSSCAPCSTYCSDCKSQSTCNTCIDGFQIQSVTYGGISASYCVQKCGDGRRFELDCDDGNNINGDGCSRDCKIQTGWACSGGSSLKASLCTKGVPQRTYLQLTGTVHLFGRIVQGIRLSYIPENLTLNDCALCYNLLWIRVIKSDIVPGIRISYLPKSKYQFLAQFQFHGTFSIPTFNIAVQINPQYSKFFSRRDMTQIQIRTIDPSVLAMKDVEKELSLDDISTPATKTSIKVSNSIVQQIFN